MAFLGSKVYGQGFVLTPDEHDELVTRNRRNTERIFPYIGGAEVNSSSTQDFDRYVISFGQMELEEAERWPDLLSIVREKVKPERDKNKREVRRKYWWQFGETTPALYAAIEGKQRCLVNSQVSKHLLFAFQPTDRVFAHTLYIYPLESDSYFAILQSRIHEAWARLLSSSMRNDLRYSASDCFDTFPFPPQATLAADGAVEQIGQKLYETRAKLMVEREQGLTTTYNQLKDPEVEDPAIQDLRALHLDMDRAVLAAYGWADIEPPAFTDPVTDDDARAKEAFEDEVIDRLFALNAERADEEKTLGLTSKRGKTTAKKTPKPRKKTPATKQLSLTGSPDPEST